MKPESKYYSPVLNLGETITELLCEASSVRVNDIWYPVLGYDEYDDVLCLDGCNMIPDVECHEASTKVAPEDIRVEVSVLELPPKDVLDKLKSIV